jgi:hypothetical protein
MKPIFLEADKTRPLYHTWWNMMARCYVEIAPGFENYGGRGIDVSINWHTFVNFSKDMGGKKIPGMSIDRIDNEKGYSFENCKWSSKSDQMLNRRQFKNNSTGFTGVVKIAGRFEARFHHDGVRYRLGRFDDANEAKRTRDDFVKLFNSDKTAALAKVNVPTVWCTSDTKIRGVTKHGDGGYVVRGTKNGVRHYVGYFLTLDEAIDARREFDKV